MYITFKRLFRGKRIPPPTYPPKLPQEMKILRSLNTKKIWLDQIEDKLGYSNISLEAMMR